MKRTCTATTVALALLLLGTRAARADTVVQVSLPDLLEGRSVTTLTGGQIVPFTLPTDGGGLQNAFATKAVAAMQGAPLENALPDDGRFPADARHPEVVLNFSNDADSTSPQTLLVPPSGVFSFEMPEAIYSKVFLFFNGAAGGTTITVTLQYLSGPQTQNATIPDYYADIPADDPLIFNLATDLAKWDVNTTINEANHHNITGVELTPAAEMLNGIQVERGLEGNLVFWGATGIATSDLPGTGGTGGMSGAGGVSAGSGGTSAGSGGTSAGSGGTSAGSGGTSAGSGGTGGAVGGAAGASPGSGGNPATAQPSQETPAGCGCRFVAQGDDLASGHWLAIGAASAGWLARRRQRIRPTGSWNAVRRSPSRS